MREKQGLTRRQLALQTFENLGEALMAVDDELSESREEMVIEKGPLPSYALFTLCGLRWEQF